MEFRKSVLRILFTLSEALSLKAMQMSQKCTYKNCLMRRIIFYTGHKKNILTTNAVELTGHDKQIRMQLLQRNTLRFHSPLGFIRYEPRIPTGRNREKEETKDHRKENFHQPGDILERNTKV